jgi:hypothetical protein
MPEITIATAGDDLEKQMWNSIQPYFGCYERFWRMHVVPLRQTGFIYLRDGLDPEFEMLAMCHYSCFVNLGRALYKIDTKTDDFKFSEEIYANLQRAAELALKVVETFRSIHTDCMGFAPPLNIARLEKALDKLKQYRNTLHDPLRATAKDEHGIRLIPRREHLDKYHLWTSVMYQGDANDFVSVETQLRQDFAMLGSVLQSIWREMEIVSGPLVASAKYVERRENTWTDQQGAHLFLFPSVLLGRTL